MQGKILREIKRYILIVMSIIILSSSIAISYEKTEVCAVEWVATGYAIWEAIKTVALIFVVCAGVCILADEVSEVVDDVQIDLHNYFVQKANEAESEPIGVSVNGAMQTYADFLDIDVVNTTVNFDNSRSVLAENEVCISREMVEEIGAYVSEVFTADSSIESVAEYVKTYGDADITLTTNSEYISTLTSSDTNNAYYDAQKTTTLCYTLNSLGLTNDDYKYEFNGTYEHYYSDSLSKVRMWLYIEEPYVRYSTLRDDYVGVGIWPRQTGTGTNVDNGRCAFLVGYNDTYGMYNNIRMAYTDGGVYYLGLTSDYIRTCVDGVVNTSGYDISSFNAYYGFKNIYANIPIFLDADACYDYIYNLNDNALSECINYNPSYELPSVDVQDDITAAVVDAVSDIDVVGDAYVDALEAVTTVVSDMAVEQNVTTAYPVSVSLDDVTVLTNTITENMDVTVDDVVDVPTDTEENVYAPVEIPVTDVIDVTIDVPITGDENIDNMTSKSVSLINFFPFCLPFDLIKLIGLLQAEPEAPYFEIPFVIESIGFEYTFVIDLAPFEPLAKMMRTFEKLGFVLALILLSRKIIGA